MKDLKPIQDLVAQWHQEIKECCPKYMVMCSSCAQQLRDAKALEKILKQISPETPKP
jgi:hypothetical protein